MMGITGKVGKGAPFAPSYLEAQKVGTLRFSHLAIPGTHLRHMHLFGEL